MAVLQQFLMIAQNYGKAGKKIKRRDAKLVFSFLEKVLTALDENPSLDSLSHEQVKLTDYLPIRVEWASLIYLYVDLCMKDKQYRSVLFGFGSKSDEDVVKKISSELVDLESHLLKPLLLQKPEIQSLIDGMHEGFRLYFNDQSIFKIS